MKLWLELYETWKLETGLLETARGNLQLQSSCDQLSQIQSSCQLCSQSATGLLKHYMLLLLFVSLLLVLLLLMCSSSISFVSDVHSITIIN